MAFAHVRYFLRFTGKASSRRSRPRPQGPCPSSGLEAVGLTDRVSTALTPRIVREGFSFSLGKSNLDHRLAIDRLWDAAPVGRTETTRFPRSASP